jgi:Cu(I)/Ag(I) efflux system periplasmic protein CusF
MKHWIWAGMLVCATSVWAAPDWTQARIVKIESEKVRITLNHQPIKSIGMEAMIMPFKVDTKVSLEPFKVGQKVRFTVTEENSHLVVNEMERIK